MEATGGTQAHHNHSPDTPEISPGLTNHIDRLLELRQEYMAPFIEKANRIQEEHPYTGVFRPELLRAEGRMTTGLAKIAFELIRLVPHTKELLALNKEYKARVNEERE